MNNLVFTDVWTTLRTGCTPPVPHLVNEYDICSADKSCPSIIFRNDLSYMIQHLARSRQLHINWAHTKWDVFNPVNCIWLLFRNVEFNFALTQVTYLFFPEVCQDRFIWDSKL